MATPKREMRQKLEELGYEFDREGGNHEVFIHPQTGARFALNRGETKDPKTMVSKARLAIRNASANLEPGEWQGWETLSESTGIPQYDMSNAANYDQIVSGWRVEKRKANKDEKTKLGLPSQTRYLWRAFKADPESPIPPKPKAEAPVEAEQYDTEKYAYCGEWDLSTNIEPRLNVARGALAKAFTRNNKVKDYTVERRDITAKEKDELSANAQTRYLFRLVITKEAAKELVEAAQPKGYKLGTWATATTIAKHLKTTAQRIVKSAQDGHKCYNHVIERTEAATVEGEFASNVVWVYRATKAKDKPKPAYSGGWLSAKGLSEALGISVEDMVASATKDGQTKGINGWYIQHRNQGRDRSNKPVFRAARAPIPKPDRKQDGLKRSEFQKAKGETEAEEFAYQLMEENENLKKRIADVYKVVPEELSDQPLDKILQTMAEQGVELKKQLAIQFSAEDNEAVYAENAKLAGRLEAMDKQLLAEIPTFFQKDSLTLPLMVRKLAKAYVKAKEEYEECQAEMDEAFGLIPPHMRENEDLIHAVRKLSNAYDEVKTTGHDDPVRKAAVALLQDEMSEVLPHYVDLFLALVGGHRA